MAIRHLRNLVFMYTTQPFRDISFKPLLIDRYKRTLFDKTRNDSGCASFILEKCCVLLYYTFTMELSWCKIKIFWLLCFKIQANKAFWLSDGHSHISYVCNRVHFLSTEYMSFLFSPLGPFCCNPDFKTS